MDTVALLQDVIWFGLACASVAIHAAAGWEAWRDRVAHRAHPLTQAALVLTSGQVTMSGVRVAFALCNIGIAGSVIMMPHDPTPFPFVPWTRAACILLTVASSVGSIGELFIRHRAIAAINATIDRRRLAATTVAGAQVPERWSRAGDIVDTAPVPKE